MKMKLLVAMSGVAVLALLVMLGPTACSDDVACPNFQLGAVQGTVTSVGQPVAGITLIALTKTLDIAASAVTDSAGHYRLDLANGLYQVEVQFDRGAIYLSSTTDTVRVASSVTHLDFPWGRADISVGLPPEFTGRDCRLYLQGWPPLSTQAKVVDGLAVFSFPLVNPGPCTMRFLSDIGNNSIVLPAAMANSDDRDTLMVGRDFPASYAVDFSRSFATLSGRIIGNWAQVGGSIPSVDMFSPDSLRLGSAHPDAEGNFTLELLSPREIVLRTDCWNGIERWFGGGSCAAATHFDLQPGDRITGVEIPESRIRVTLNGPGGMIYHHAAVRLTNDRGEDFSLFSSGGSEPLVIGGLHAGRWFLQVNGYNTGQTWAAQWYRGADSLAGATPIDLATGEATDLAMDLVPGGSISGRVLLYGGVPLVRIECAIFDSDGRCLSANGEWNWDAFPGGNFQFTGLPNGSFYLAARLYYTESVVWYPGTTDFAKAEPVMITGYSAVTGIDWNIIPGKEVGP